MGTTQNATGSINCPKCDAVNSTAARFCGVCGTPLQGSAAPPPFQPQQQFQPPPPPPPPRNIGGMMGGAGPSQGVLNADVRSAFDMALQGIQNAGGTVKWQAAPQSAKFSITKRSWGWKTTFDGDMALTPMGPRQTAVRLTLKPNSSAMGVQVGSTLLCAWLLAMSGLGWFGVGLAAVAGGWGIYMITTKQPAELAEQVLISIPQTPVAGGAQWPQQPMQQHQPPAPPPVPQQHYSPPPPPPVVPQQHAPVTPVPPPIPEPASNSNGSSGGSTANIVEQLKQLGELRAVGVLTQEEFDAKKAEMLKRL
ncbi:MAG: SHOCT domain-containing protein [Gemmatimonadota bacterium]|nr:SHOCT domain-containing protein [Gemmatimonadota bacterium]